GADRNSPFAQAEPGLLDRGVEKWIRQLRPRTTKDREIDRVGHRLVAGIAGMQMVARVVLLLHLGRIARITRRGVEVDDPVEHTAASNPRIHGSAFRLHLRGKAWPRSCWGQRRAEYNEPVLVSAIGKLMQTIDDVVGRDACGDAAADVVDA